jgi:hypothetical protein
VEETYHQLARFTASEIATRWGYDPHYWVMFFGIGDDGKRKTMGASRHLGLHDPRDLGAEGIEVEGGTVLPGLVPSGQPLSEALAMAMSLKGIAEKDSQTLLAREQIRSDQHMQMMMKFFDMSMARAVPTAAPTIDPTLAAILAGLTQQAAATNALLARLAERDDVPEEPEEPDELTDDEKVDEFKKLWKKEGVGALKSLVSDETIESVFKLLPKLKAKMPDAWAKIGPLLQQQVNGLLAPAAVPTMAPAPTHTAPARPVAETTVNGAPPPAAAPKPKRDQHTPTVE